MSAKHYIENIGIRLRNQLFSSTITNKSLEMVIDVDDEPAIEYVVRKDNSVVVTTKHLSIALETYDSL